MGVDQIQVMFEFMNILEVLGPSLGSDIDGNNAGDAIGSSVPLDSDGDRLAIGSEYTDCGAMAFKKLRNKK